MNSYRSRMSHRGRIVTLGLLAIFVFLGLAIARHSYAQVQSDVNVIQVNAFLDEDKKNDGVCTLREAIIVANQGKANSGKPGECQIVQKNSSVNSYVVLLPKGVYTLYRTDNGNENSSSTGDLDINANVTVRGLPDASDPDNPVTVVISGGSITDRVFHILSGNVTIENVTVRDGKAAASGGGILNEGGNLKLINSSVLQNHAGTTGGGLANANGATSTLTHVTVKGNTSGGSASGLARNGGTLVVRNSLIDGNGCSTGIDASNAANNLAYNAPGCDYLAISVGDPGYGAPDLTAKSQGGLVAYYSLGQNSAARDAANNSYCAGPTLTLAKDQVGRVRLQGPSCDIGAYEADVVNSPPVAGDQVIGTSAPLVIEDISHSFALNVTDANGDINWGSFTLVSGPSHGTITGPDPANGNKVTYVPFNDAPNRHYNGDDGFPDPDDTFTYFISDDAGLKSNIATVQIEITPDDYIEVLNLCDNSAEGSLRAALTEANQNGDTDNIVFDIVDYTCGPFEQPGVPATYPADPNTYDYIIDLQQALPNILHPLNLDGLGVDGVPTGSFTPPSNAPYITLDGDCASFSGLTILGSAGGSTIANLVIQNMGGSGIEIGQIGYDGTSASVVYTASDGNTISGNVIANNGCNPPVYPLGPGPDDDVSPDDGITIWDGDGNTIEGNDINNNADLPVDLGGDGVTGNDYLDEDLGANDWQNTMRNLFASPAEGSSNGQIRGILNSAVNSQYTFQFYVTDSCPAGTGVSQPLNVTPTEFSTDSNGVVSFSTDVISPALSEGEYIYGTVTDDLGNTSEYSNCIRVDDDNVIWPNALALNPFGGSKTQKITQLGQSRWYKIEGIAPGSKIKFNLDLNLPQSAQNVELNLDLVGFGDIEETFIDLLNNDSLAYIDANFPTEAFSAAQFNAAMFNAAQFNAAQFNAAQFNAAQFNAAQWNELVFNPALLDTAIYSEDVWSSAIFSAAQFNAAQFNAAQFNAAQWNAAQFNPADTLGNAYASAQMASVIAVSGNDGQDPEEVSINTYGNGGTYYARVRGRQGGFDEDITFTIEVNVDESVCTGLDDDFGLAMPPVYAGNYDTIILVDYSRMDLTDPTAFEAKINQLAGATNGIVVDLSGDPNVDEIARRNQQADQEGTDYRACPYAKNIVAEGIKETIDSYDAVNDLEYVVIIGDDDDIPFFRIADRALLGPEEDYVPPVDPDSASEASLRNNTILTQDPYVSDISVDYENTPVPIPTMAIGRLVETEAQITNMIDVYLNDPVINPTLAVVEAYDFLKDSGTETSALLAGSPQSVPVTSRINDVWTADDMRADLATLVPESIVYLAGHFSANAALAADYQSIVTAEEFSQLPNDFVNSLIFSAGCHVAYNIVNDHGIPATFEPDWAAAMALQGTTLIGGTGFQYADTDFNGYSEWLYTEFARQLRSNAAQEIPIGEALRLAKLEYLKENPTLRGIDQKSILIATIFGLPMTKVNMPGQRFNLSDGGGTLVTADLTPAPANPGQTYGLKWYDLTRSYNMPGGGSYLTPHTVELDDVYDELDPITTSYLQNESPGVSADDGVFSSPGEPALPLDKFDATIIDNDNLVLRDVGFVSGSYTDFAGQYPLMGAPGTELSQPHYSFLSFVFYPQVSWLVNRFDALAEGPGGSLVLNMFPAQYRSEQPTQADVARTATLRRFDELGLRLFYLPEDLNNADTGLNDPKMAAPPTILQVQGSNSPNPANNSYHDLHFGVQVVVDPSAGIQDVWVSYTRESTGNGQDSWQSMSLTQDPVDSSWWYGTLSGLPGDANIASVAEALQYRFIAQAVSGTGLVTMSNNLGRYYLAGEGGIPTTLVDLSNPQPTSGAAGTIVSFTAKLTDDNGDGIGNQPVLFSVGQDFRLGWTSNTVPTIGEVSVDIPLTGTPAGIHDVIISYPGSPVYQASNADTLPFEVFAQDTVLILDPASALVSTLTPDVPIVANLYGLVDDGTGTGTLVPGQPLWEKTVLFTVKDQSGTVYEKAVITDPFGQARLGEIVLPQIGFYTVTAEFMATSRYNGSSVTAGNEGTISFVRVFADGKAVVWPTNNKMLNLDLRLDDGSNSGVEIVGYDKYYQLIQQDEPLTGGADAAIENIVVDNGVTLGGTNACVRAARDGNGNGRVYRIEFQLIDQTDSDNVIAGEAFIGTIPHDQGGEAEGINDAPPYYDSIGDGSESCPQ